MAILTTSGRIAMAEAILQKDIFLGWGEGQENWGVEYPAESINTNNLFSPVGFRRAKSVQFCTPDPQGSIEIPTGSFSTSEEPTNHLYFEFVFDFNDASDKTIKEVGVFIGTIINSKEKQDAMYYLPLQIQQCGRLLLLEHRKPIFREVGVKETFEFVVSF